MPAINLSEISEPFNKGDLAYIRAFQESDTGAKLDWQLREAMPIEHPEQAKGWRACLAFYRDILAKPRGDDNQPTD